MSRFRIAVLHPVNMLSFGMVLWFDGGMARRNPSCPACVKVCVGRVLNQPTNTKDTRFFPMTTVLLRDGVANQRVDGTLLAW